VNDAHPHSPHRGRNLRTTARHSRRPTIPRPSSPTIPGSCPGRS
jgi:hypothetical protein